MTEDTRLGLYGMDDLKLSAGVVFGPTNVQPTLLSPTVFEEGQEYEIINLRYPFALHAKACDEYGEFVLFMSVTDLLGLFN